MPPKSPHLIERAAARLLKSGNVDKSLAQLLAPDPADAGAAPQSPPLPHAPSLPPAASGPDATMFAPPQPQPHPVGFEVEAPAPQKLPPVEELDSSVSELEPPPSVDAPPAEWMPASASLSHASLSHAGLSHDGLAHDGLHANSPLHGPLHGGPSHGDPPHGGPPQAGPPQAGPPPPAGRIIETAALERAGMIDWEQPRSRVAEEFRIAQRQILRNAASPATSEQGQGNLIMVTSARPGEGKSFFALNLASSIARQRDHDVLLVITDHKRDSIGPALGLSAARGLLDLMVDPTLDADDLIVRTGLKHLSILPIGQQGALSGELFASRRATRLIQSLARRYADRLVILDTPPCLAASEPGILAPIVGQTVMVVEAEQTQREEIEASIELIQDCPAITLLLNKVQLENRHGFGSYYSSYILPYKS
jgi:protein-tyrosine kinase